MCFEMIALGAQELAESLSSLVYEATGHESSDTRPALFIRLVEILVIQACDVQVATVNGHAF
jgi:hypothetical protein